jgi:hypothetical protein
MRALPPTRHDSTHLDSGGHNGGVSGARRGELAHKLAHQRNALCSVKVTRAHTRRIMHTTPAPRRARCSRPWPASARRRACAQRRRRRQCRQHHRPNTQCTRHNATHASTHAPCHQRHHHRCARACVSPSHCSRSRRPAKPSQCDAAARCTSIAQPSVHLQAHRILYTHPTASCAALAAASATTTSGKRARRAT